MSDSPSVERQIAPARLSVRRARAADHAAILELTGALELTYPALDLSCFWVADLDGVTVGAAELKDFDSCSLMSCVGVREDLQGRGIGRELVDHVVREARHAVYLYTLVPGFFRKAGFREAATLPPDLPPRSIYGCSNCDPSLCLCMMRPREDT